MNKSKMLTLMGDFETTVYDGQTSTEVWASALVQLGTEDVKIFHSIDETYDYLEGLNKNLVLYYHNLKFDGTFWIDYLLKKKQFKQAYSVNDGVVSWLDDKDMKPFTFKYSISDMGQWYTITIKLYSSTIYIRDSLKLLPFSVKRIGNSFQTKHKKLDMEYTGYRYAGCTITDEEKEYIANDVLVVKEALEIMFAEGHNLLTIGACCLKEFKQTMIKGAYDRKDYANFFPQLYDVETNYPEIEESTVGDFIRKSYRGGWCYVVSGKEKKLYHNGITADVNSLYPSVMHSMSGSIYPVGKPTFWIGNEIPKQALMPNKYFFIRIKTRFRIKEGMLPFIQIKGNLAYRGNEMLTTSNFIDPKTGIEYDHIIRGNGSNEILRPTLTLTMTDYKLFLEHYDVEDFEIIGGCYFSSMSGIFDEYIEKYKKIKQNSKGAKRELAKLFLNNLYGKMATNTNSSFKLAFTDTEGNIHYGIQKEYDKEAGYIAIGSAITSYARNFTIRTAQKNYHGVNERGFIYADTDSIHCDLRPEELVDVPVHPNEFCHWKLESSWDTGWFVRQKTYIEHIVQEDLEDCEPYYNVKCAGLPQKSKELLINSFTGKGKKREEYSDTEWEFVTKHREITDFKEGITIPGKLLPCLIDGGTILKETTFELR